MIVVVVLSLSLYFGFSLGTSTSDTSLAREYHLTDKITLAYKRDFCQSIVAQSTDDHSGSNASLYMLSSRPPPSDKEYFNVSINRHTFDKPSYFWSRYYLNTGSNVSLNVCLKTSNVQISFYLVKGLANFNAWISNRNNPSSYELTRTVSSCSTPPIAYTVSSDDMYFFIVFSRYYVEVHATMDYDFQRTVYHISPESVVQTCSFPLDGVSSCSVAVPFSSGYTALLSLDTSPPVNYDSVGTIKVSCESRVWLYAMIVVCSVLPFIVCLVLVLVCLCVRAQRNRRDYKQLTDQTPATPGEGNQGKANIAPGANGPPSYSRLYPSLHQGYGTNTHTANF